MALLQKRPIILRSLLIVANPQCTSTWTEELAAFQVQFFQSLGGWGSRALKKARRKESSKKVWRRHSWERLWAKERTKETLEKYIYEYVLRSWNATNSSFLLSRRRFASLSVDPKKERKKERKKETTKGTLEKKVCQSLCRPRERKKQRRELKGKRAQRKKRSSTEDRVCQSSRVLSVSSRACVAVCCSVLRCVAVCCSSPHGEPKRTQTKKERAQRKFQSIPPSSPFCPGDFSTPPKNFSVCKDGLGETKRGAWLLSVFCCGLTIPATCTSRQLAWVMSHVAMSHVTHKNESCHTYSFDCKLTIPATSTSKAASEVPACPTWKTIRGGCGGMAGGAERGGGDAEGRVKES